jgi:hypothetical protein
MIHDTTYLALTYWERFHNYLGTSEDSILNFHWSDGFGVWVCLSSSGRSFFAEVGWPKKMLSNEELYIYLLKREIYFYRERQRTAIDCLVTSGLDHCRKSFTTKSQYQHYFFYQAILTLLEGPNVKLVHLVVTSTAGCLCQKIIPHFQHVDNTFVSPYFYVFNLFHTEILKQWDLDLSIPNNLLILMLCILTAWRWPLSGRNM